VASEAGPHTTKHGGYMEIIIHDVLQDGRFSASQLEVLKIQSFFTWFKQCMKPLEGVPVTLACIAHGVHDKEWVDYIKKHPEWDIQFHGLTHADYRLMGVEETVHDFNEGIKLLEETFGKRVKKFYAPKHRFSDVTVQVASGFEMKVIEERRTISDYLKDKTIERCYAHFWHPKDIEFIREYVTSTK
jgi:hypothetical protein